MAEVFVAKAAEFPDGDRRIVQTGHGDIGVFRHAGEFFAYSNTCPHSGGPACEGVMMPRVLDVIDGRLHLVQGGREADTLIR